MIDNEREPPGTARNQAGTSLGTSGRVTGSRYPYTPLGVGSGTTPTAQPRQNRLELVRDPRLRKAS